MESPNTNIKMDTNYIGHHVSSGGFVFYRGENDLYVVLVKNKYNQWWIPKGHIEKWENHTQCAFREIEEEVGIPQAKLDYVDFYFCDSYSYEENGELNTKDLYIHIFEVKEKVDLKKEENEPYIIDVAWFTYEEALELIAFNKKELIASKDILKSK